MISALTPAPRSLSLSLTFPYPLYHHESLNLYHYLQVTVSGTADAVAKATRAIKDLVTKGYSKLIAGEDFQESSISVRDFLINTF